MTARSIVVFGVFASFATLPSPSLAEPPVPEELPVGFPITDPAWQPQVIGYGHTGELPAFDSPTVLFVNFDGAVLNSGCGNDSHNDCSVLSGQFDGEILPYTGDASKRAAIVQAVRSDVTDFGVIVVGERPPSDNPYAMVLVGDSAAGGVSELGFAGVSPVIDCGNSDPNETSFALEAASSSNGMATIIHQEAAHTWGLEHVNDPTDNLHPSAGGSTDPKYNDVCNEIVGGTDLQPTTGRCNSVHTMFCDSNWQNSYQEMLALFGPPVADDTAPTAEIESPMDGEVLECPANFDFVVTLDDDRRPQTMGFELLVDGDTAVDGSYIDATHTFPVNGGLTAGPHTFRVEITDEAGNEASDEVTFEIAPNPDDPDCLAMETDTDSDTTGAGELPGEEGCACRAGHAPAGAWQLALILLPLLHRRRRDRA